MKLLNTETRFEIVATELTLWNLSHLVYFNLSLSFATNSVISCDQCGRVHIAAWSSEAFICPVNDLWATSEGGSFCRGWTGAEGHTNVHASSPLHRKSSREDSCTLLYVVQGWLRPWYRSSSSHRPKFPLRRRKISTTMMMEKRLQRTICPGRDWGGGNRLSLRSKRFRGIWEQRKTKERGFWCFACAKNGARATKECKTPKIPFLRLSLLPDPTETLATQVRRGCDIVTYAT